MTDKRVRFDASRSIVPRVEIRGQDARWYEDVYHRLLVLRWWQFFAVLAVGFVLLNALFALSYLVEPGCIMGARNGSYEDAFFFSVQTLATIGYGTMAPVTFYAHCVVTLEAFTGLVSVALMTGITFAKFARPTARVLFGEKFVISRLYGQRVVLFRMANWRGNFLVEAQLRLVALMDDVSPEGEKFRRPIELRLVRDRNPSFFLTWTAMHVIDDQSPFAGDDPLARLRAANGQILLTLSGLDETAGATIHARHTYALEDAAIDARFADVITLRPDGVRIIDYSRFHDVEPAKDGGAPRAEG